MRISALSVVAVGLCVTACTVPAEEVSEPAVESAPAPLNGVSGAGIAFVRWWDSVVAFGNVTTGFSQLSAATMSTNGHYPFQAVRGPNVGAGNGSLLTYELNATTGTYRLRAKRTNSAGTLVAEYPYDLPAPNNATHIAKTGATGSDVYFFFNNDAHTGTFYTVTYNSSTSTYSSSLTNSLWSFSGFSSWDVVVTYPADCGVLLYNTSTGAAFRGRPNLTGGSPYYDFVSVGPILDPGTGRPYTHVAYTPSGHVFYNMHYSYARRVKWTVRSHDGVSFADDVDIDTPLTAPGLNYTHLVATTSGKAFFYNDSAGTGRTLDVVTNALSSVQSGFSTGWTTLTAVE